MIVLTQDYVIAVAEGDGDNLHQEDIDNGCVDYLYTTVYKEEHGALEEVDGGDILTEKLVKEMDAPEIAKRVADFWGGEPFMFWGEV